MKIQVVRVDGGVEIINLVGSITAHEPAQRLDYPRNQSPLHVEATGMDYFFREDGQYDGWGMQCGGMPTPAENDPLAAVQDLIDAVEADREFPEENG